jgi:hypothetical protein
MKGIAIERWTSLQRSEVFTWLHELYGAPRKDTWYEDQDYDLLSLMMADNIYCVYCLRWT